jgi:uncharacterized protein involved in exopolysaccharide biosynthesis
MALVAASALLVAFAVATLWPPSYVSTGTILIEQQEVPTELVRSTISSYADQRIQVISQRVMTTSNLLRIIEQYKLFAEERRRYGRETVVGLMRANIRFRTISADVIDPRQGRPTQATIAFSVGFVHRSPEVAAQVANELASLFLEENLKTRRQLTDQAESFFTEEAGKLSRTLAELESRLAEFKEQNSNSLPEVTQLNIQMLNRMDEDRDTIRARIDSIDQQLLFIDSQLAQLSRVSSVYTSGGERVMSPADRLKVLRSEFSRAKGVYSDDHPDVVRLRREIEGLERSAAAGNAMNETQRQLTDAESELAQLRQRYGADHPDILRTARLIESLREALSKVPAVAAPQEVAEPDNPAYIQLRTQREAIVNERASLQGRLGTIGARQNDIETRLGSSPGVERDYAALRRNLESTYAEYQDVRQKQMQAQLAQSLEVERKGERFALIEPPMVPEEPDSPNRGMILALGSVLALAMGVGTALLLEMLDGSIRGIGGVSVLLTAAPLAVIPLLEDDSDRQRRLRRRLYLLAATIAAVLVALLLIHLFYRPLDVLWLQLSRRLTA